MPPAEARSVVAPVAEVVDAAGHRRRRGTPGDVPLDVLVAPSPRRRPRCSRNRSSSVCRPCSIRTSGRPRSATASRMTSYGGRVVERDPERPAVRRRRRRGRAGRVRRAPATSASRPSSTSTVSRPVSPVNSASGAARRSRPRVDRHEEVADLLDLAEQVAGEDDRDPELAAGPPDEVEHLVAAGRVEAVRRLVEEEQPRIVDEGLGELDALAHPGRVAADRPVALLVQPDVTEHLGGPFAGRGRRQAGQLGEVGDELGRADIRRQALCSGM